MKGWNEVMIDRKKLYVILCLIVCALLLTTACGSTTDAPASVNAATDQEAQPQEETADDSEGDAEEPAPSAASDLGYPTKPIELVVPYAAGGAHDMYSRAVAAVLPKYIGMPVNVNLISGGSGTIGSDYCAKAAPDGYTLMLTGPSPGIALLHTSDDLTYNLDSFDYICYINGANSIVEVAADSPFNSFEELVEYAREHPGELRYASSGVYSASHITTETIADDLGLEFVHVPYDSGGASSTAVVAGEVDFGILTVTASRQLIEGGMLKAFAVTTPERDTGSLSDVPTMKELGHDGVYYTNSRFIVAPAGLPADIFDFIEDACRQMAEDEEFITLVENMGEEVEYMGSVEFRRWVDENYASLEPTMKRLAAKQ